MGPSQPKNPPWRSFEIRMDSMSKWYSRTEWTNSRCKRCDWLCVNPLLRLYKILSIPTTHVVISQHSLSTRAHFHLKRSSDSSSKIFAVEFGRKRSDPENSARSNITSQCTEQQIENFIRSFDISWRMSVFFQERCVIPRAQCASRCFQWDMLEFLWHLKSRLSL
jgi:hypothetical protein